MSSLSAATTPAHGHLEVPAGWRQGRGAYGGLSVAAMIRAAEQAIADPTRQVRSVTAELFAPVDAGGAELPVEVLRTGSSLSAARVAIVQGGTPRAHAVVIAAATRTGGGPAWQDLAPPDVPSWRTLPEPPAFPGPEFTQHFEYRLVEGLPGAGAPTARAIGWVRAREPGAARDAAYLAAMIDVWFPAAFVRLPGMRPMATIAYTLDVLALPTGLDPEAPLLFRSTSPVAGDGYTLETRELWGEDGRLLAINHQTFAVLG